MMTRKEECSEFWMLTKGILQDGRVDVEEARVVRRWLEEHQRGEAFARTLEKLERFLSDGYIDRFESRDIVDAIGNAASILRTEAAAEA